jgi:hypothetical protein
MVTSVYTGLNTFNFIRKHFLRVCARKVAVHLQNMFEVMSTSVWTGLNPYRTVAQVHSDFSEARYRAPNYFLCNMLKFFQLLNSGAYAFSPVFALNPHLFTFSFKSASVHNLLQ